MAESTIYQSELLQELQWRGLIHDLMPGTDEELLKGNVSAYIGFDPTSDSLHVGSLVQIILLKHLQAHGHRPVALVGGATGMIGDPSGKTKERNLLDTEALERNITGIQQQLSNFIAFDDSETGAKMVNNYDWFKEFSFLVFIRDVGKHISVNYMVAKDSVKKRMETGISFTEFSYQLVQGYDFLHLYRNENCKVQMGGSDQWGNITTGTELIRRVDSGEAFAITSPLITKADGSKFGKSEGGNVWLDPNKTSAYKFLQFWLNVSDEDAVNFIKIFTFRNRTEIEELIKQHEEAPHLRVLQNVLGEDLTTLVHSKDAYEQALEASKILFGRTDKTLADLSPELILEVLEGVPQFNVQKSVVDSGVDIVEFLSETTKILSSKSEVRRSLKENSLSVNKTKIKEDYQVNSDSLIHNKFCLVQRGKKNYFLVIAE